MSTIELETQRRLSKKQEGVSHDPRSGARLHLSRQRSRSLRLMLVQDESDFRSKLADGLRADGCEVLLPGSSEEIGSAWTANWPDLILLDALAVIGWSSPVLKSIAENSLLCGIPMIGLGHLGCKSPEQFSWPQRPDVHVSLPFHASELRGLCQSLARHGQIRKHDNELKSGLLVCERILRCANKDVYDHGLRVADYSIRLAIAVGLSPDTWEPIQAGALFHDIGKLSTPATILNKTTSLSVDEFHVMQQHPVEGDRMFEPLDPTHTIAPIIHWHHERMDGKGYPDGLLGSEIPLAVRIVAVADVYDALSTERVYRSALPVEHCLDLMQKNAHEGGLDPQLVEVFTELMCGDTG